MKKLFILLTTLSFNQTFHANEKQENISNLKKSLLIEIQAVQFAQHLSKYFGQDTFENFIIDANEQSPEIRGNIALIFNQAGTNFHKSQSFSQISIQGKSLEQYLEELKNIQEAN